MNRCAWGSSNPLMIDYHDTEWGVPLHDEQKLFEFLVLEGMQAGLSWSTILNKRENFRAAFHHFDVARVARYTRRDVERRKAIRVERNARRSANAKRRNGRAVFLGRQAARPVYCRRLFSRWGN